MKRLILAAILIFPVISLVIWLYFGATQRVDPNQPPSPTNAPGQVGTNNSAAK
jgi:hypothetical protein